MARKRSEPQTMSASDVRQQFAGTINKVARDSSQVVIEKNGVPVAAIVPMGDLRRLQRADAEEREIEDVLNAMSEPFAGVPPETIERETERILAEMKAEERQSRRRAAAGR